LEDFGVARPQALIPDERALGLVTDLYELTMAAGYWSRGHNPQAAFEAFARALPENRHYLLLAGLEQVIHYLQNLRFAGRDIDWLRSLPAFNNVRPGFWDFLRGFQFQGDVWAVPEGTVVFAGEPLVRVAGSLLECQLLETCLLTTINAQTLVATKAARICREARGKPVVEFGARRAHGPQMGLYAARAAYIGGAAGTSNVYAARLLGIPAVGTMAHSWIMSFPSELESFQAYAEVFPNTTICLIDTYDTPQGARNAAQLKELLAGVRLDSGDLCTLGGEVRKILDDAGLHHVRMVASSDLNEYTIRDLVARGAPFDSFGVGTDLVTSKDAPALAIVYKLVEVNGAPVRKFSHDKATWGGAKQIFRTFTPAGEMQADTLGLADEKLPGEPVLRPYMAQGAPTGELPGLNEIRDRSKDQLSRLPDRLHDLRGTAEYPVFLSEALKTRNRCEHV
jgi:nicotinate phosphoribosyltransferase